MPVRPLEARPQVLINGRPARGNLRPLEADLSQAGAVYRMSFTCSQNQTLQLRWVSGLAEGGQIGYRAGSATFHEGGLVESTAADATQETFWYR